MRESFYHGFPPKSISVLIERNGLLADPMTYNSFVKNARNSFCDFVERFCERGYCKVRIFKLTWLFKFLHCSTVSAIPFDPGYLINELKILQNVNFFNFDLTNNIIVLSSSWWLYKLIKYIYHSNNLLSYLYV